MAFKRSAVRSRLSPPKPASEMRQVFSFYFPSPDPASNACLRFSGLPPLESIPEGIFNLHTILDLTCEISSAIIKQLKNNPKMTQLEPAMAVNVSGATVQRIVKQMVEQQLITRVDSIRGYWKNRIIIA